AGSSPSVIHLGIIGLACRRAYFHTNSLAGCAIAGKRAAPRIGIDGPIIGLWRGVPVLNLNSESSWQAIVTAMVFILYLTGGPENESFDCLRFAALRRARSLHAH